MTRNRVVQGIFRYMDVFKGSAVDMEKMVREDIYSIQRVRTGEMVSYKEEESNIVGIGFAICHPSDMKRYNKEEGRHIAYKRAIASHMIKDLSKHIPHEVKEDLAYFCRRTRNYFQGCILPWWAEVLEENYIQEETSHC